MRRIGGLGNAHVHHGPEFLERTGELGIAGGLGTGLRGEEEGLEQLGGALEDAGIEVLDDAGIRTQLAGEVRDGLRGGVLVLAGVVRGAGERVVLPVVVTLGVKGRELLIPRHPLNGRRGCHEDALRGLMERGLYPRSPADSSFWRTASDYKNGALLRTPFAWLEGASSHSVSRNYNFRKMKRNSLEAL